MQPKEQLIFGSFRLDAEDERLWHGTQALTLKPKTFAVLRYLVEHAGRLVTKEALLEDLWPGVYVSDAVLKVCIREIREALGDGAKAPRFIETVHRRGYRFIAAVQSSRFKVQSPQSVIRIPQSAINMMGRETELAQLHKWLEKANSGERQVVFVTGEAGIGKTTVVDAFVASAQATGELWIGRGQCIDHYGPGEAYLPVLEALGRLCREPGGEQLIALLAQQAPTWLVHMPAFLSAAELEALQRKAQGATQERMLREMVEALEALTAEQALVLWLEDLQWSDVSTLDLLAVLARRRERAQLLVIGTYRPVDVILSGHPLKAVKQELQLHGQCEEMPLKFLSEGDVAAYLAERFAGGVQHALPLQRLAEVIHQRTGGNPLFMVNIVDEWAVQGVIVLVDGRWELRERVEEVAVSVPESLRQLIAQQSERLSPEDQQVLEAASVAGGEFSAAAVAAAVAEELVAVEKRCEGLVQQGQFLRASGTAEWPDGTVAARYAFLHALYQEVLYERVTAAQRVRLHQRIGERVEAAYGSQVQKVAAELAAHFERGRDYRRAVQYLQQAGENAARRSAYIEAVSLLTRGLELLQTLPDTPERAQQELTLQVALGGSLMATKGYTSPEAERVYARARELCRQVEETPQLFPVLWGLCAFYGMRGEVQTARELEEQLWRLAQRAQDPALLLMAHRVRGANLYWRGELALARAHLEQGIALYDRQQHHALAFRYVTDPGVHCLGYAAGALWHLGYPDQALQRIQEALTLAQELAHPASLAYALDWALVLHNMRREMQAAQERAEALIALSTQQGLPYFLAEGTIQRGWALAEQGQVEEGIAQIRQGLAAYRSAGAEMTRPGYLAMLAAAYEKGGQAEEGLNVLAEALVAVHKAGQHIDEAGLYWLKGELLLKSKVQGPKSKGRKGLEFRVQSLESEAEECFRHALDVARRQSAKSLELRAAMSLARLWQHQGKKKDAHQMLADIYGWFTEGFDTADLQEARVLLTELL